ncbi:MAG TPA: DUF4363 family protein [Verrucomicrobiae bacterium]|nr:DUF4363 family protein [Verrucomicrobiae bacterium]
MKIKTMTVVGFGFVLLLVLSWAAYGLVDSAARQLSQSFEQVEQSVSSEKWDLARENLNLAHDQWETTKQWWSILLDHQEIDNIDISISRLEKYVETHGLSLSLGEVSTLKMLVEHISDKEKMNLKNVL